MIPRLRFRLFGAFAGMAAIVLALASISLTELYSQKNRLETGVRQSMAIMISANELRGTMSEMQRLAFQAGMEKKEDMLFSAGAKAGEFFDIHKQLLTQVRQLPDSEDEIRAMLLGDLDRIATSFRSIVANSLALIAEQIERGEAQEAWFVHMRLASKVVGEELDRFVLGARTSLDGKLTASVTRLEQGILLHWGAIGCAFVGLLYFLYFLSRQVSRPMRSVAGFVERASESPLETAERYQPVGLLEVDTVGQGVNTLLEHLQYAAAVQLAERHEVLKSVATASSLLLSRHDDERTIAEALRIVGSGLEASRAYIFECHSDTGSGESLISQRHEWCADDIEVEMANPDVHNVPWERVLPRWPVAMRAGESIGGAVAAFPEEERPLFQSQQILSLLCVPILINETLWGFLGLDDCRYERQWTDFEIEALKSVGADIGNLILWQRATEQLRLSTQVFLHSGEAITVTDIRGRIVSVNPAFSQITGYQPEEVVGRTSAVLKSGRHDEAFYAGMWRELQANGQWQGEIWNRRKNGEVYPEWLTISSVRTYAGETTNYVAIFTDITERKAAEKRIEFLAHHDPLTGLPNRSLLVERIEASLAMARRTGRQVALLFLDLDHFKTVNDSLGHAAGDSLLRLVADRLKRTVRETDTVCRQGGDEFIILLSDLADAADAGQVAVKLLSALEEPLVVGELSLHVTVSVGVAIYPEDGDSTSLLLKNADMAMYAAKESGRNAYRFFTLDMQERVRARLDMEARLRHAIEAREFEVHFQPQWNDNGSRLLGAEALVRWRSAAEGLIPPGRFIPIAEESGLIVQIGQRVLHEACHQAMSWRCRTEDLVVAVNVSPVQVLRSDLIAAVSEALTASGLPPARLELEITESLLVGDDPGIRDVLNRLKAMGVKLAIDDFGTGYSSLAYLKRFSVDRIKIDQSFVRDIVDDAEDAAIVRAIVQMAKSLHLNTIAEGVETAEQMSLLGEFGCDEVQGYLLGRPMPAADFERLVRERP